MSATAASKLRLIDIGANLTDEMYSGLYNGSQKHEPDLDKVLGRAWATGLEKIIITSGNLKDIQASLKLAETDDRLFTTVGVHPTRCSEFDAAKDPSSYIQELKNTFDSSKKKFVALGEFGLDYERTQFCDVETQKKYFRLQLEELGPYTNLPLFLHCRNAAKDLHSILVGSKDCYSSKGGVVHSFDGTAEEMRNFVDAGFHIGINGCSLKTKENCDVVKEIPVERLLLETDAPWCGIRPSHFSSQFVKTKFPAAKKNFDENMMYKTRNEPHTILNILEVVAAIKEMKIEELADTVFSNSEKLFFSK